jgi:hypothetical protein
MLLHLQTTQEHQFIWLLDDIPPLTHNHKFRTHGTLKTIIYREVLWGPN